MIARDLPPEIALRECRLNIENQYSTSLAYLLIDVPVAQLQMEYSMEMLKTFGIIGDKKQW